jgi:hypothetical protein
MQPRHLLTYMTNVSDTGIYDELVPYLHASK